MPQLQKQCKCTITPNCTRRSFSCQCSTIRNRTVSPLLRLPGEIRNSIYAYAFHDTTLDVNSRTGKLQNHHQGSRGLVLACRQALAEANQICMDELVLRLPSRKGIFIFHEVVSQSTMCPVRRISLHIELARFILECHDSTSTAAIIGSHLASLDTVYVHGYWNYSFKTIRAIITNRLVRVTGNESLKVVFDQW